MKKKPILTNLVYYVSVIALVAVLALMFLNWRHRQSQFVSFRDQVSQTEEKIEIESRKADEQATDTEAGNTP